MGIELAQLLREAASELRANIEQQYGQSLEYPSYRRKYDAAMELPNSMDAASASLEAQEPVAEMQKNSDGWIQFCYWTDSRGCRHPGWHPSLQWLSSRHPPTSAVPDGWQLVPVEPTPEMVDRGAEEVDWYNHNARDCYGAMLAAAPQQGGGDDE